MHRLCLFAWIACVLNRTVWCLPAVNYTSISNRESISEEDKIRALEGDLLEGDLVMPAKENGTESRSGYLHSVARKSPRWPNAIINFKLDKRFYDDEVSVIIKAMLKIERASCIRFRPYKSAYGSDYVKIIRGNGCFSSAGRIGGLQILSLGRGCINIGTAMHELLHSVGFYHHHMRPDRDKYLTVHYENIRNDYKSQFKKLTKSEDKLLTPFDYQSIMIYGNKAFSKNKKPTMTAKIKNVKLTYPFNKNKLTRYDIVAINRLYQCSAKSRGRSNLMLHSTPSDEEDDSEVDFPRIDELLEKEKNEELHRIKLEKERQEKEQQEKERKKKEQQEKAKQDKERQKKAKLEKERLEKARRDKEGKEKAKQEKERQEKAKLEKERVRLEEERREKERLAKERQARLEKEREEREKVAKERQDKLAKAKNKEKRLENLAKERKEKSEKKSERSEKERQEAIRRTKDNQPKVADQKKTTSKPPTRVGQPERIARETGERAANDLDDQADEARNEPRGESANEAINESIIINSLINESKSEHSNEDQTDDEPATGESKQEELRLSLNSTDTS